MRESVSAGAQWVPVCVVLTVTTYLCHTRNVDFHLTLQLSQQKERENKAPAAAERRIKHYRQETRGWWPTQMHNAPATVEHQKKGLALLKIHKMAQALVESAQLAPQCHRSLGSAPAREWSTLRNNRCIQPQSCRAPLRRLGTFDSHLYSVRSRCSTGGGDSLAAVGTCQQPAVGGGWGGRCHQQSSCPLPAGPRPLQGTRETLACPSTGTASWLIGG